MRFFGTFRRVSCYVDLKNTHIFSLFSCLFEKKHYLCAKLPNKSAPNYWTNRRQITEFSNIILNINHLWNQIILVNFVSYSIILVVQTPWFFFAYIRTFVEWMTACIFSNTLEKNHRKRIIFKSIWKIRTFSHYFLVYLKKKHYLCTVKRRKGYDRSSS